MMACFSITFLISLLWALAGYSLALTDGGAWQRYLGGFSQILLTQMTANRLVGALPESVFSFYHMTFAIFAPTLIVGSLAERTKFFPLLLFCALWELFVYIPVCHWIWGDGWLAELGVIDFAGGIVVHGSAGIAAMVVAILLGPRTGFPGAPLMPHNLTLTAAGAGMLWVGWHGFSAGSALMVNGAAGMALLSTHLCAAASSLTWIFLDWRRFGKPSALGMMTGMIAGLSMIAAGAGFISPFGACLLGVLGAAACFYAILFFKQQLKIDDALDVFPIHGVSGVLGALLMAVFANETFGGSGAKGIADQLYTQMIGIITVMAWSASVSFLLFKFIDELIGLRVSKEQEAAGLDISLHDQQGYNL